MCNPLDSAAHMLATLRAAMKHLVLLLVGDDRDFDHNSHRITAVLAGNAACNARLERSRASLSLAGKESLQQSDGTNKRGIQGCTTWSFSARWMAPVSWPMSGETTPGYVTTTCHWTYHSTVMDAEPG